MQLSRLFESFYTLPQLRLFELDETRWLKALKVGEYTLRKPRRPRRPAVDALLIRRGSLATDVLEFSVSLASAIGNAINGEVWRGFLQHH